MSIGRVSDVPLGLDLGLGMGVDENLTAGLGAGLGLGLRIGGVACVGMEADEVASLIFACCLDIFSLLSTFLIFYLSDIFTFPST